jgi:hypothetical protein
MAYVSGRLALVSVVGWMRITCWMGALCRSASRELWRDELILYDDRRCHCGLLRVAT